MQTTKETKTAPVEISFEIPLTEALFDTAKKIKKLRELLGDDEILIVKVKHLCDECEDLTAVAALTERIRAEFPTCKKINLRC